jgi:hypothetical protein
VIPAGLLSKPVTAQVFVESGSVNLDTYSRTNSVSFSVTSASLPNSVTLLIGDTPADGVAVLSFSVTVTGAVLEPGDLALVKTPVSVEINRLQVETTLLADLSVPASNYTSLTVTFSNPQLTILNNTGAPIGTCANGSICELRPVLSASSVSLSGAPFPLGSDASTSFVLLLDFDLSKAISSDLATISPALTAQRLVGQNATHLVGVKQVVGTVVSEGGDSADGIFFNMSTNIGLLGVNDDNTQYVDAGGRNCRVDFGETSFCLLGQLIELDARLFAPRSYEAQRVIVIPSNDAELEGVIVAMDGSTQFDMVLLHEVPDVAGVEIGNLVRVNLAPGATFEAVDTDLTSAGLLFSAFSDLLLGQVVSVRVGSAPSGTPPAINADRVRLKSGAFTAKVRAKLNSTDFIVDNLPGNFAIKQIQVRTNALTGFTSSTNISGLADLNVGDTVSLSGFLIKTAGDPVLLAEGVRKR